MSVRTITRVWEYSKQSSTDLLLLLAIADHADDDGVCWPGIPRLAQKTRTSERQTIRNIEKLAQSGEIFLSRQCGRGHSNLYFITVGLSHDEIIKVLQTRFEMGSEAIQLAKSLISMMLKGDTGDRVYPEKKVTSRAIKGDIQGIKGDIQGIKGDIAMSPEPSIEPSIEPSYRTGVPQTSNFSTKEETPGPLCQSILDICCLKWSYVKRDKTIGKAVINLVDFLDNEQVRPDEVIEFNEWRKSHHWTGRDAITTPKQIGELWGGYEAWVKAGRYAPISKNGAKNDRHPTQPPADEYRPSDEFIRQLRGEV